MTPVRFKFMTPEGEPLANTAFEIELLCSSYHVEPSGVVLPRMLEAITDVNGEALVELWPLAHPYQVTAYDPVTKSELFYKFVVPVLSEGVTELRLQDIIVSGTLITQSTDPDILANIIEKYVAVLSLSETILTNLNTAADAANTAVAAADAAVAAADAAEISATTASDAALSATASAGTATTAAGAAAVAQAAAEVAATAAAVSAATAAASVASISAVTAQATETVRGTLEVATAAEAQGWASDLFAITPVKLDSAMKGANQLLATSGYQKLPGGLIIQWGNVSVTADTNLTVVYPLAFPSAVLSVQITEVLNNLGSFNLVRLMSDPSTTQFIVQNANEITEKAYWMAIGI